MFDEIINDENIVKFDYLEDLKFSPFICSNVSG
ncbi:MAG: hypothetical protein Ct9H90mP17_3660 [Actinomycetota bacterium]|nr:MAG: hypothetical protein Ct9H90mP17_3660 [Actinomycetota bacterium]